MLPAEQIPDEEICCVIPKVKPLPEPP